MVRQPYIYTLPEAFIEDKSVPMHWKLYTIINGFWISGKTVFASNQFFAEKLGCTERHIQGCLEKLEEMGLLERIGKSQNRKIVPKGTNPEFVEGRTDSSVRDELSVHHISDSNSDSNTSADEPREIVEVFEESERASKKPPKYPNARTVFAWFPNPEPSWKLNTTELKHAELLFLRGEAKVRSALAYVKAHQDDDFFYSITSPSELERKWVKLVNHK
jgi:DNA-binding Lrp family transcriptional regulator